MENYYQRKNQEKNKYCQRSNYLEKSGQSKISSPLSYQNEFSHEDEAKIFKDVYSCIGKFYQLVYDARIDSSTIEQNH